MATLEIDAIRDYLIQVGCKIEYPILVNAFKQHLYNADPNVQGTIRTRFKDYVNRLATVSLENNMKFIILRPEFRPKHPELELPGAQPGRAPKVRAPPSEPPKQRQVNSSTSSQPNFIAPPKQPRQMPPQLAHQQLPPPPPPPPPPIPQHKNHTDDQHRSQQQVPSKQPPSPMVRQQPSNQPLSAHQISARHTLPPQLSHNHRQPSLQSMGSSQDVQDGPSDHMSVVPPAKRGHLMPRPESLELTTGGQMPPPRPPPRRRDSTASLHSKLSPKPVEKSREIIDLARKSLGRVKEHALKLNSSTSSSDLSALMPVRNGSMKENRLSRDSCLGGSLASALQRNGSHLTTRSRSSHREDESDSSSMQPIDPLRRKWAIEACNCNYNGLLTLLREDPKLGGYKDIVNGYTALHWAAKFGNLDIIKLIAGTYGVSANIKSSAGYTPLHIACLFNRSEAADLLLNSYQANPNIRDHSGKRPAQYLVGRCTKPFK